MSENILTANPVQINTSRSKTATAALLLGIASLLLGLMPALLGLLIKILKVSNAADFARREGVIGIGGLLGIFGLLIGLPLALAAFLYGRKTSKKIKAGQAPVSDRTRSRLGILCALTTALAVPVLLLSIFLLSEYGFAYQVEHLLVRQGIANPPGKPN